MKKRQYHFYQDQGHGWLKVSSSELVRLGIHRIISPYSYQRGDNVYLEEDEDLTLFVNRKISVDNVNITYIEHHTNRSSRIRGYYSYEFED